MNLLSKLLHKNISGARLAGFVISNFIGLAIVTAAIQFYIDAASLIDDEDSFIHSDYIVVNKKVTSRNTLGMEENRFGDAEIAELAAQPWVRSVGRFTSTTYRVDAAVTQGGHGMRTQMFFESIPGDFVDVPRSAWIWHEGDTEVPIIISKEYLTLYNFGFAAGAGLPQMSEGLMSGIPLSLTLTSDDGGRQLRFNGRIAGYSNRLNTILVPEEFMRYTNATLGTGETPQPSRLIIDVSSPGDVAIAPYLQEHDLEMAGDKTASQASFLLRLVTGIIIGIGALITILSLAILLLSISLIMEKNRPTIHGLLMLGYDTGRVGGVYRKMTIAASVISLLLAVCAAFGLRAYYLTPLQAMGAEAGPTWIAPVIALLITCVIILFNLYSIRRNVLRSFR